MTRLPRVAGKEIVRALQKAGFSVDRTRGSHVFRSILMAGPLPFQCIPVKSWAQAFCEPFFET